MNNSDRNYEWKQEETVIAIEGKNPEEWDYIIGLYCNLNNCSSLVTISSSSNK